MPRSKITEGAVVMAAQTVRSPAFGHVCMKPGEIGFVFETYRSIAIVFCERSMPLAVKRDGLVFIGRL